MMGAESVFITSAITRNSIPFALTLNLIIFTIMACLQNYFYHKGSNDLAGLKRETEFLRLAKRYGLKFIDNIAKPHLKPLERFKSYVRNYVTTKYFVNCKNTGPDTSHKSNPMFFKFITIV